MFKTRKGGTLIMTILLCDKLDDAIIAYIVKKWNEVNLKVKPGRTIIQKVVYFLKAKGIPINYDFEIYRYGPYSQELYYRMDDLIVDNIIKDVSKRKDRSEYISSDEIDVLIDNFKSELEHLTEDIDLIVQVFNNIEPSLLELLSTIHYLQTSFTKYYKKAPSREIVVNKVLELKKTKFSKSKVEDVYDIMEEVGLFNWDYS